MLTPAARTAAAALTLALAVASAACRGDGPEPSPSPDATTPTESSPGGAAVTGAATLEVKSVHHGPAVFNAGDPRHAAPPADVAAINAFVVAVQGWLDRHLTDLQAGGQGLLGEVAAPGLVDGSSPEAVAAVTTQLAGAQRPVTAARYAFVVAETGAPQWLHVTADVEAGGTVATAQFVLVPGDPRPSLVASGPVASPPAGGA